MKLSWIDFREWYNSRGMREQVFVLLATCSAIFMFWKVFMLDRLLASQAGMEGQISFSEKKIDDLKNQYDMLKNDTGTVDKLRQQVDATEKELVQIDKSIGSFTQNLISPTEMTIALRTILSDTPGLTLTKIESLSTEKLVKATSTDQKQVASDVQLYKHGMVLEFQGDYFSTYNYLVRLEHLKWQFLWDSILYKVEKYPVAKTRIVVHTLSDNEAWIGA